jgi:hypothetical protein
VTAVEQSVRPKHRPEKRLLGSEHARSLAFSDAAHGFIVTSGEALEEVEDADANGQAAEEEPECMLRNVWL